MLTHWEKCFFFDAGAPYARSRHCRPSAQRARAPQARENFEELHLLLPAAAVIAAAGGALVLQQRHNNRSGHGTDVSSRARAGEALRLEAGGSGGACMLGGEGSIAYMMAEHTGASSGASSLFGPKIDRVGR